MTDLSGKVALVTGAGQGVGQGIALALAAAGASVALAGGPWRRSRQSPQQSAARGGMALAWPAMSRMPRDLANACGRAGRRSGSAGSISWSTMPRKCRWDRSTRSATRPSSPVSNPARSPSFRLMKLAHPHLKARGGGTMFNLASSAGVRWDMAGYGAYGAVKQATRALTRAAAAEWGRENIRVLTIAPHAESPGLKWWIENNPDEAEAFFRTIPLGRIGSWKKTSAAPWSRCADRTWPTSPAQRSRSMAGRPLRLTWKRWFAHCGRARRNPRGIQCALAVAACPKRFAPRARAQHPHQPARRRGRCGRGPGPDMAGPATGRGGAVLAAYSQCPVPAGADLALTAHCQRFAAWLVAELTIIANTAHPAVPGERTWGWSQASFISFRQLTLPLPWRIGTPPHPRCDRYPGQLRICPER